ncbi:unnamed protein product [Orchesella dallaii]|uniref:Uncharacterized protein n=1 Tax=Orchesella dallaii TaxID=48710 RepID=A0ABP1PVG5_9HEXA
MSVSKNSFCQIFYLICKPICLQDTSTNAAKWVMWYPDERNPFPSGKFMFGKLVTDSFLVEDEEPESNQLYRMFPLVASRFGNYIYQLIYCFGGSCSASPLQLREIPRYLLNLKDLMFVELFEGTTQTESVREIIESFPTYGLNMEKLTTFRCYIHNGLPVMKAILKQYSSQLEQLNCFGSCLYAETFSDNQLSGLKILKVWRCNFSLFEDNYSILSGLFLKVLKLEFTDQFIEDSKMVRLINALPKSIINLTLKYPCDSKTQTFLKDNIEDLQPCPNLKCLTISYECIFYPELLSKVLMNPGGGIELLALSFVITDYNLNYVNGEIDVLFGKYPGLQTVELQQPNRLNETLFDSAVKIGRFSRRNLVPGSRICLMPISVLARHSR